MNKRELRDLIAGSAILGVFLAAYILATSTVLASDRNPWYALDFYPDHAHVYPSSVYLPLITKSIVVIPSVLNVPTYQQECDQWCWAGVSQMVLAYYGTHLAQCNMADYAWSRTDCCPASTSCSNANCNTWNYMYGSTGSLQGILSHWGVHSVSVANYLSYNTVKQQIQSAYPIVIRFGWYGGGGHFLIIRGYNDAGSYVTYNDPWTGTPYIATYAWVVHADYDHDWTHTLYNVKP
jgi:hypothetical protein